MMSLQDAQQTIGDKYGYVESITIGAALLHLKNELMFDSKFKARFEENYGKLVVRCIEEMPLISQNH